MRREVGRAMSVAQWRTPYLYLVKSRLRSPIDEPRWNEWYDQTHLRDLLSVPGFRGAARYAEVNGDGYLAVYEIESPEVFDEPRYREVTGWGEWHDRVAGWTRTVARVESDELRRHEAAPGGG